MNSTPTRADRSRDLLSERSWAMIELKIEQWDMHIFLAVLEEVYALDSKGRFLDAPFIWRTITHDLRKSTRVDSSDMDKLSESYVA